MGSSKSVGSEGEPGKAASEVHADSIGLRSARRLDRHMHENLAQIVIAQMQYAELQSHKCNSPNGLTSARRHDRRMHEIGPNDQRTNAIRRIEIAQMQFAELQSHVLKLELHRSVPKVRPKELSPGLRPGYGCALVWTTDARSAATCHG